MRTSARWLAKGPGRRGGVLKNNVAGSKLLSSRTLSQEAGNADQDPRSYRTRGTFRRDGECGLDHVNLSASGLRSKRSFSAGKMSETPLLEEAVHAPANVIVEVCRLVANLDVDNTR